MGTDSFIQGKGQCRNGQDQVHWEEVPTLQLVSFDLLLPFVTSVIGIHLPEILHFLSRLLPNLIIFHIILNILSHPPCHPFTDANHLY